MHIISLVAMALPLKIIIYVAMALLLVGAFGYQLSRPAYAAKKGRQVDVRVLSCGKKMDEDEEGEVTESYEVTVDFYDINGEVLVKTLQSEKPYTEGDVIRCCYLDKTGGLFPGTAQELLAGVRRSMVVFFIFFVVFMGIAAAIVWGIPRVNEKPEAALPAYDRDRQGESSAASAYADMEKAFVLELFCHHEDEELEICDYSITIYEDGSGRLLIFPVKTVSGKGIDQEIGFTVSQEDREKIMQWIQETDGNSLTQGAHRMNETAAYASLTIYDSGKRHSGGGYCDDGIYAEICGLLQQVVPAEAWEEMEKRESAYYQR